VDKLIKPFHPMRGKSFRKVRVLLEMSVIMDWVTGAFFAGQKRGPFAAGGWDEDYFMYMEEV